jgi:phasin family protein
MAEATEAKIDTAKAEVAAEKAYAAAAAAVEVKAAPAAKPAPAAKKVAAPKAAAKPVAAKKTVAAKKAAAPKKPVAKKVVKAAPSFKDTIMTKTTDFTAKVSETVTEAQDRAKAMFEKSQAMFGEAGEFTKGNVEALVESGKILATGLQDLGKDYVAEGKTALETVQADFKELTAVKTPADFFKLQGEMLRRNFDAAVASGSKYSEKTVKLAGEAFAPIQNRVSLAVEKVKQAA